MAKKEKDIKDMSFDELTDSLNSLKKEVFNIGIQKMAGQFEDTSQISKKKKNIARVKTMMNKHKKEVNNA
jgi:ribosomal protein L29